MWPWVRPENAAPAAKKKPALTNSAALFVGLGVSGLFYWFDYPVMAAIVAAISLGILLCSLFVPKAHAAIERFLARLSHYAGLLITWLLLVPLFYIWFTLGRFFLWIRRKDPLERELDYETASYWQDKGAGEGLERYRRQV